MQEIWQGKLDAYHITDRLVAGRFGDTHRARRVRDDLDVIIKTIQLDAAADWQQIGLFEREAERLRRLEHPHIAAYIDDFVVDVPGQPRDRVALVQLPAAGRPLSAHPLPMSARDALAWFIPLLDALTAMHERLPAVVHGDLDPGNLILDDAGHLTIVDLASVRQAMLSADRLASGLHAGGLSYAAPEQRMGRVEPATDLYAAALIYLYARTGLTPQRLPARSMRPDLDALDALSSAERALLTPMLEPDPTRRLADARIARQRAEVELAILRQREEIDSAITKQERVLREYHAQRDAELAAAQASYDTALDQAHRAMLHNVSLSWRRWSADASQRRVSRSEAWRAPRPGDLDRIHSFAIAQSGGHTIFAHARQAIIVEGGKSAVRAELTATETVRRAAISDDGRRAALLTGLDTLTLYDVGTSAWAKHTLRVEGMWPGHSPLVFSPQGDLVATGDDDQLDIYSFATGKLVAQIPVDARHGIVFGASSDELIAVGEGEVALVRDRAVVERVEGDGFARLPDGKRVALVQRGALWIAPWGGSLAEVARHGKKIPLDLAALAGQLSIVRPSPDGRRVLVAGHEGVFMMVDVEAAQVSVFDPIRALARDGVKLLEAGWSADSRRLFIHGTLPCDAAPGIPRTGCVGVWTEPRWALGGVYAWRGTRLMLVSEEGFFGDLQSVRSSFSGGQGWERASVAQAALEGLDPLSMLSPEERRQLAEYQQRRAFFSTLVADPIARWELIDRSEGLAALLPAVLRDAAASPRARQGATAPWPGAPALLEALGQTSAARQDALAQHADALQRELPEGEDALWRWLGLPAAEAREVVAPAPVAITRSSPPAQLSAPAAPPPSPYEKLLPAPASRPTSKPQAAQAQLSKSPPPGAVARAQRATFQAIILGAFLGYLPVYAGIWLVGVNTLDQGTFWFLMLSIGPILGILAYHAVARRLYKI